MTDVNYIWIKTAAVSIKVIYPHVTQLHPTYWLGNYLPGRATVPMYMLGTP